MKAKQEDFMWGALIGSVLGAATALLLTPASGTKMRQQIQNSIPSLNRIKRKIAGRRAVAKHHRSSLKMSGHAKRVAHSPKKSHKSKSGSKAK